MNPSMLFRWSDSRLDIESLDSETVAINFWNTNGKTQGIVRLNKDEMIAVRNWLTLQIGKVKKPIPVTSKKPSK